MLMPLPKVTCTGFAIIIIIIIIIIIMIVRSHTFNILSSSEWA